MGENWEIEASLVLPCTQKISLPLGNFVMINSEFSLYGFVAAVAADILQQLL